MTWVLFLLLFKTDSWVGLNEVQVDLVSKQLTDVANGIPGEVVRKCDTMHDRGVNLDGERYGVVLT